MQGAYDNEVLIGGQLGLGQARDASGRKRAHSWLSMATETHAPLKFSTRFLWLKLAEKTSADRNHRKAKSWRQSQLKKYDIRKKNRLHFHSMSFFSCFLRNSNSIHPCHYDNDNFRCIFSNKESLFKLKTIDQAFTWKGMGKVTLEKRQRSYNCGNSFSFTDLAVQHFLWGLSHKGNEETLEFSLFLFTQLCLASLYSCSASSAHF